MEHLIPFICHLREIAVSFNNNGFYDSAVKTPHKLSQNYSSVEEQNVYSNIQSQSIWCSNNSAREIYDCLLRRLETATAVHSPSLSDPFSSKELSHQLSPETAFIRDTMYGNKYGNEVSQSFNNTLEKSLKEDLFRTRNSDTKVENHTCCGKVYNSKQYHRHLKCLKHSGEVQCSLCQKFFNSERDFDKHCVIQHSSKMFLCQICHAPFSSKSDKAKHYIMNHKELELVAASCGANFSCEKELNLHSASKALVKEIKFKPVECCGLTFQYQSHLERHRSSFRHNKILQCKICDDYFDSPEALKEHRLKVHVNSEEQWSCLVCFKSYASNGNLKRHINTCHTQSLVYECNMCSFKSHHKTTFQRHVKFKHSDAEKNFTCEFCGMNFFRKTHMASHIKNIHEKKGACCFICHRGFASDKILKRHQAVHCPCEICGETFNTLKQQEIHRRIHTSGKFISKEKI